MKRIELLYKKYSKDLLQKAFEIVGNKEDAYDLVNMTFEWAIKNRNKYKLRYIDLLKVCVHTSKRIKIDNDKKDEDRFYATIVDTDPALIYEEKERFIARYDCLLKIKSIYRQVLILNLVYELSPAEIAKKLNIKPNTASKQIARGKILYEKILKEKGLMR